MSACDAPVVLEQEFNKIDDVNSIRVMDLLVLFYKHKPESPAHLARVFMPQQNIESMQVINKNGTMLIHIETIKKMLKIYNKVEKSKFNIKFYREKYIIDQPKIADLLELKDKVATNASI
ncbi:hypothetical protein [Pelagibaculum spongiae]|uniref:Uncharacterized protein n=1 Tax=Pelagibaculum spongiae TaxID=2080658 RepID=A0A2V1GS04_9GAMM|nr:hypothetical protein [Pelagibaculum spongiae]PVZ67781.1 hypothetical protein DC094_15220 [Pelagibaculum spongiae]